MQVRWLVSSRRKDLLRRRILLGLFILLALFIAVFVGWANTPARPMPEALLALESDDSVQVKLEEWLIFKPVKAEARVGLIFYPGGRVDPRAYAPAAKLIASNGYLTVIVPMTLNLAVLSPSKGLDVVARFPEITHWVIGGHSLGGAMAANLVRQHPGVFKGLVLWASYPPESSNLAKFDLLAASVIGSRDGLVNKSVFEESQARMPEGAIFYTIDGGNHAQFGWYGEQSGDQPATISRDRQQQEAVEITVMLLEMIAEK